MPAGSPTGCYGDVRDYDVGVVLRLELGAITIASGFTVGVVVRFDLAVITIGFASNVKRAEVAASDHCAGKSDSEREIRRSDSRV